MLNTNTLDYHVRKKDTISYCQVGNIIIKNEASQLSETIFRLIRKTDKASNDAIHFCWLVDLQWVVSVDCACTKYHLELKRVGWDNEYERSREEWMRRLVFYFMTNVLINRNVFLFIYSLFAARKSFNVRRVQYESGRANILLRLFFSSFHCLPLCHATDI